VTASVELIDDLEGQITEINHRLKQGHADDPYIPLLMSAPGTGWVLAFTIAAEIDQIERFSSPEQLAGYTGLRASTSRARGPPRALDQARASSLPEAPLFVWRPDRPFELAPERSTNFA
jgi:transposase